MPLLAFMRMLLIPRMLHDHFNKTYISFMLHGSFPAMLWLEPPRRAVQHIPIHTRCPLRQAAGAAYQLVADAFEGETFAFSFAAEFSGLLCTAWPTSLSG